MIPGKLTLFSLLVLSAIACFAQSQEELQVAYARKSEEHLDSFLLKSKPKITWKSKITDTIVDSFLHAVFVDYADRKSADSEVTAGNEKYIIVQPQVEVGIVEQLDSAALFDRIKDPVRGKESIFSEKKVFRPFLSPRLVVFKDMKDLRIYEVNPNMKMVYRYQPLVIDTSAINDVNTLLGVKGIEHVRISAFLEKDIKLYKSMYVDYLPDYGRYSIKFFNVSIFIDRIVLNEAKDAAFLEFSFPNAALQAYYKKINGGWRKMKDEYTLQN